MRLRVSRVDCVGHGICAELLPEWIGRDEGGYPVVNDPQIPQSLSSALGAPPTIALCWRSVSTLRTFEP